MSDLLNVPPTRGNMIAMRKELEELQSGHDLLDHKRQVLIRELMKILNEAEKLIEESRELFKEAYESLQNARMDIGIDRLKSISLAPGAQIKVELKNRTVMGIVASEVKLNIDTLPIPYGPGDTSVSMDDAYQKWLAVVKILDELVQKTVTTWRFSIEVRKTQRRVNALEKIRIPRYKATIKYISDVLEENDREEIVAAKKVKELTNVKDRSNNIWM